MWFATATDSIYLTRALAVETCKRAPWAPVAGVRAPPDTRYCPAVWFLDRVCARSFTLFTGPDKYYYEIIECGRRILLTGVLIFIAPHTTAQTAMSCIFAFASLLGFELLRPHLDPTDSYLYRLVRCKLWCANMRGYRSACWRHFVSVFRSTSCSFLCVMGSHIYFQITFYFETCLFFYEAIRAFFSGVSFGWNFYNFSVNILHVWASCLTKCFQTLTRVWLFLLSKSVLTSAFVKRNDSREAAKIHGPGSVTYGSGTIVKWSMFVI